MRFTKESSLVGRDTRRARVYVYTRQILLEQGGNASRAGKEIKERRRSFAQERQVKFVGSLRFTSPGHQFLIGTQRAVGNTCIRIADDFLDDCAIVFAVVTAAAAGCESLALSLPLRRSRCVLRAPPRCSSDGNRVAFCTSRNYYSYYFYYYFYYYRLSRRQPRTRT